VGEGVGTGAGDGVTAGGVAGVTSMDVSTTGAGETVSASASKPASLYLMPPHPGKIKQHMMNNNIFTDNSL
jgi:hypothetical protein